MSHFTVMVIGEDVEGQLAPFHEFECTGQNDQYVQDVDVTAECLEEGLDYHGLANKIVSNESEVDRNGKHMYGYAIMRDGVLVKAVNRTNPNKKWDWWQIGGRWNGYFKLKAGVTAVIGAPGLQRLDENYEPPTSDRADQCLKGDIDFDTMRAEAIKRATERFDLWERVTRGLPPLVSWETIRERHGTDRIEEARKEYHAQPIIKALWENKETTWFDADDFSCGREKYIERARRDAISTFAVVKDGKWYERGDMGWWGIVHNESDPDQWNDEFYKLLESVPDSTLLTIVDCHI